jgi:penicillin G amidase
MYKFFLLIGRLATLLFLVACICVGGLTFMAMRSLPDYEASHTVTTITAPVEIVRDANAVPHIKGKTQLDVFFGLGYAHAQDRLWQMNITRRLAQGRLSELVGETALNQDILMRTLDLETYAKQTYAQLPLSTIKVLQAYSDGVNSWIEKTREKSANASPEFLLSRTSMEAWRPYDSILIQKLMAFNLADGAYKEIQQARFASLLTDKDMEDLFPSDSESYKDLWKSYAQTFPPRDLSKVAQVTQSTPAPHTTGASNIWAVNAERTTYKASLLASDPHLQLQSPSTWYAAHLEFSDTVQPIGATIPGIPIILIGHNRTIGWGISASQVDTQDLYFEQINPANPNTYKIPGGFEGFKEKKITIYVKDAPSVEYTIRWSRNGSVLPETYYGLQSILPEGHVATLQWTALTAQDKTLAAGLELMGAQSLSNAITAVQQIDSPSLNFALADKEDVAFVVTGRMPRRSPLHKTKGRLPAEGWLPQNRWLGFIDNTQKPKILKPTSGVVANANNRTTQAGYPNHLSFDWAYPYRIKRIDKLLNARKYHTLSSFTMMQNDTISEMARTLLPLIGNNIWWDSANENQKKADILARLKAWNGDMNEHQAEPLIFVTWMRLLKDLIVQDELNTLQKQYSGIQPLFLERVFQNTNDAGRWCDIKQTPEQETCSEIAGIALDQAITQLSDEYGDNVDFWRWGKPHTAIHRHIPYGYAPILEWFFNIQQETSGGDETIMRGLTAGSGNNPNRNIHASGYKMVIDFSDLRRSQFVVSTGQSGHPFSRYYDDMAQKWRIGEYVPMILEDDDIQAGSIGTTHLIPEGLGE